MKKIAILAGDGIGPEVMQESLRVLEEVKARFSLDMTWEQALIGGAGIDVEGAALPQATRELCSISDAVLLGAVGGPKWDHLPAEQKPEIAGLLALRKYLQLYANLRPVQLYSALRSNCPVVLSEGQHINIMTVRELSSGVYFEKPKVFTDIVGLDTMKYERTTVERIAITAFKIARNRSKKICSVDKANVLSSSMLWRSVVKEVGLGFPDVCLEHMYVDNAAMQIILNPSRFDVILTENLFGDILSDETAALAGSLGMLPSASIGSGINLYEPAGGSAPEIAGKGIANPIAQILSIAMMLEYSFSAHEAADAIERAITQTLNDGYRTADIAFGIKSVNTHDFVTELLLRL